MSLASTAALAASRNVAVYGDRYPLSTISSFYDGLVDTDAAVIGSLSAANLSGVQLLWAVQPHFRRRVGTGRLHWHQY